MGLLGDLTSWLDNRKRVIGRSLTDGGLLGQWGAQTQEDLNDYGRGLLARGQASQSVMPEMRDWAAQQMAQAQLPTALNLAMPIKALHGSSEVFDQFAIQPGRNPALFFSPEGAARKTQAEHIAGGPFGGQLYRVSIADGKPFDPLNDQKAASLFKDLFPQRGQKQWVEYTDIYNGSPLIKAMQEHGYNRVRVYEPSVQSFSEAVTDPSLVSILERKQYSKAKNAAVNWDDPADVAAWRLRHFDGDVKAAVGFEKEHRPNPSTSKENARAAAFTDKVIDILQARQQP